MTSNQKSSIFLLRFLLGWMFLYAGLSHVLNPNWTALGYLKGSQTLSGFYQWLGSSQNIGWVNFLNEWGMTLIGLSLVVGIFVRIAAASGILVMILYYIPILSFPYVGKGTNSFIVDQHIIFISVLFLLFSFDAGKYLGLKPLVQSYFPKPIRFLL